MQVIILAGGQGTRLRPYTVSLPKPLVPVAERPILDIILTQLHRFKATDVIISIGHMAELIQAYCGDGSKWGLKLRYCREEKPLNTAGSLAVIEDLEENFLVMNGDILTSLDLRKIWNYHLKKKALATISVSKRHVKIDFGVLDIDPKKRLQKYIEKPTLDYKVSMGINVFNRRILTHIRRGEAVGMPVLFDRLLRKEKDVYCFENNARWLDIGRPEDYETAQEEFIKAQSLYVP